MKWTVYTGQPDTLPPEGVVVLVEDYQRTCFCASADHVEGEWWVEDSGTQRFRVGDKWLPIPTEQQCEAWGAAKGALEFYYQDDKGAAEAGILAHVLDRPAAQALAAIDAAEKEVMPNGSAQQLP